MTTTTEPLRIAVLGVGKMGGFHTELLSSRIHGARVTVINDFDADRAAAIADTVGARVAADPFAAIAADDVDAVVIASPGPAHEKQVLACLERGVPVLCEKPLTIDVATARAVVEAEARSGRKLIQLGFMRRFDPEYVAAKELIDSGAIGRPLLLHCIHRNKNNGDHFDSGMMIRDSVVHEVDVARYLLDEEIASVQVHRPTATAAAPEGVSDPMIVIFSTESGRLVTVEIFVRTGIGYEVRTEVVGETGSTLFGLDQHGITKTVSTGGGRWGGVVPEGFIERFENAYTIELQRWVDAARRGTIDGPDAWDGYAAVAVCEAGVEAVRTGGVVAVDLGPRPSSTVQER
ncbi:Gfo/Idh/MocA family protein [Microlunatus soli]|uniref:Inositol 2-dehydrogenase n=1 Tax=Microlunatus soli TaxID=630515 RepID=A0A1H1XHP4_9ACTN|nr:Gfo/Idh/MocA family oxidoreductase [Microlunatus soli]SDT08226.1 myo-inositol 2-dehydrogenase / D-chiro-inositol 1-dehydrogenase [Microlunatus soli]